MKDDFLTIPDFPNYEINSELIVRIKKTGKILKTQHNTVTLHNHGTRIRHTLKNWRAMAVAVIVKESEYWVKIPSLNYLYEMNQHGTLRNAKTKHRLQCCSHCFWVSVGGKRIVASQKSLLWEAHGIIRRPRIPRPITIIKGTITKYFEHHKACAKWMSTIVHYAISTIQYFLTLRKTEICGWKVTYHEEIPYD